MVLFFLLGSSTFLSFFSYDEIITGRVVVTSENPPVHVKAKHTGKIAKGNFQRDDSISKGAILGNMEDHADEEDIFLLKSRLFSNPELKSFEELGAKFPHELNLGTSIQPYYSTFLNVYQELFFADNLISKEQLNDQLRTQVQTIKIKENEIALQQQYLNISKVDFERYEKLYSKGVISKQNLDDREKEFLFELKQFEVARKEYEELILNERRLESNLELFKISDLKNKKNLETKLVLAQQDLINAISKWEDEYLLRSPIDGRISYMALLGGFQNVEAGEVVFTVIPFNRQSLMGKGDVPVKNSGKLRKGQKAIIKLDNYPFREWGTLEAKVEGISEVPMAVQNSSYRVYLEIQDLTTSYGKQLELNQDLVGTAEIILEKTTLMERIFFLFRGLWSNNDFNKGI